MNLPNAVQAQVLKLLAQIARAQTADDLFRASDRAEGFVLGLETVKALNAWSIEGLYKAFDDAATTRRSEHEQ
ncbi:hypothetical protein DLD99_01785 [Pseudomonas kribbensis]|uniref:Uncharacterized protein n=2 Tax=Pseudomonas kribbensis TaxID=1628086 RepID=A0A345RYL0_9PSED|nr:hypothetical protein DLD99_01785 [Pseudomonas kribbensis]